MYVFLFENVGIQDLSSICFLRFCSSSIIPVLCLELNFEMITGVRPFVQVHVFVKKCSNVCNFYMKMLIFKILHPLATRGFLP